MLVWVGWVPFISDGGSLGGGGKNTWCIAHKCAIGGFPYMVTDLQSLHASAQISLNFLFAHFCSVCPRRALVWIVLVETFPTVYFTCYDSLRLHSYSCFTPIGLLPHVLPRVLSLQPPILVPPSSELIHRFPFAQRSLTDSISLRFLPSLLFNQLFTHFPFISLLLFPVASLMYLERS